MVRILDDPGLSQELMGPFQHWAFCYYIIVNVITAVIAFSQLQKYFKAPVLEIAYAWLNNVFHEVAI